MKIPMTNRHNMNSHVSLIISGSLLSNILKTDLTVKKICNAVSIISPITNTIIPPNLMMP